MKGTVSILKYIRKFTPHMEYRHIIFTLICKFKQLSSVTSTEAVTAVGLMNLLSQGHPGLCCLLDLVPVSGSEPQGQDSANDCAAHSSHRLHIKTQGRKEASGSRQVCGIVLIKCFTYSTLHIEQCVCKFK